MNKSQIAWSARLIAPEDREVLTPVFRRKFTVEGSVESARLALTYQGVGMTRLNGQPVNDEVLAPGWSSYHHRLLYSVDDVAHLLVPGENVLEISVGPGWWAGKLGFLGQRAIYGETVGALAQLEWTTDDGEHRLVTDEGWLWAKSATLSADLYDGETFDARRAPADLDFRPVVAEDAPRKLELRRYEPTRRIEALPVQAVSTSPSGKMILDFGQNLVGWARLKVEAPAGHEIRLRFAEVLEDGELAVEPLRAARAEDIYLAAGTGLEEWEPSFTFHGFRYMQVTGWPEGQDPRSAFEAVVVHTDMRRTGWFESSHEGLNRLHENVVWSMRGNFLSIPTDCPQRDERLGWTGDIAMFGPTAMSLFDCEALLQSWLKDLALEQFDDGTVPYFIPQLPFPPELRDNPIFSHRPTAVWGDAALLVPFALYEATGNPAILEVQYESMQRWVDLVERLAGESRIWDTHFQYGDWLDPSAPPEAPAEGSTDPSLVATAYFAQSAQLLARAAELTGREDGYRRYAALAEEVKTAFNGRFNLGGGRLSSDSQAAYSISIMLDLLSAEDEVEAGRRLVALVREAGHTIATGFVGTPLILHALTRVGAVEDAYSLALQTRNPSWLYAVEMGATTIWERWDSLLPDGSVNPGGMTSFNHYTFGAIASWMHRTVGGLAAAEPGWSKLRIAPRPGGGISRAAVRQRTPNGIAEVAWQVEDDGLVLNFTVPEGASAVVDLPGMELREYPAGRHSLRERLLAPARS